MRNVYLTAMESPDNRSGLFRIKSYPLGVTKSAGNNTKAMAIRHGWRLNPAGFMLTMKRLSK